MVEVHRLQGREARAAITDLAAVLIDCVEGGASVNFMAGFSLPEAKLFFEKVVDAVELDQRALLAAFDGSEIIGTVQIIPAVPPNQPHRADVAKLLVKRSARGQGVAKKLMREAERISLQMGKSLLVLDTVTDGDAERLYERLGWTKVGVIPDYCLFPDGRLCGTSIFYKKLSLLAPEHPASGLLPD